MGLVIKFLLIGFLVIYVGSLFVRYALRIILWLLGKKIAKEFKKQQRTRQNPQAEGNIHIINNENTQKKNFQGGDYIDYEEV